MQAQIVLAGVGGQGVLFASKLLAITALDLGHRVIVAETHGMSQRGGSVVSHLKIGDFYSSLLRIGTADFLVSFEGNETYRNFKFVRTAGGARPAGTVYTNASEEFPAKNIGEYLYKGGISIKTLNADAIALRMNTPQASNLILLGFACTDPEFPFTLEQMLATTERITPSRFKDTNIRALKAGHVGDQFV